LKGRFVRVEAALRPTFVHPEGFEPPTLRFEV
jgi:hypothetical protein